MSLKTTYIVSLFLSVGAWVLALKFEIAVSTALVLFDLAFWALNRNSHRLLFFSISRLLTFALYVSYYAESGLPYSFGGDDFGIMRRHLSQTAPYTIGEIATGSVINYPLFYYINFYCIKLLRGISFEYQHIVLCTLNSLLFAEMMIKADRIARHQNIQSIYWLLLFVPLIYFSSIFLRDVYVYYCYISIYYICNVTGMNWTKVLGYTLLSSLIRPESGIMMILFTLLNSTKRLAFVYVLVGIVVVGFAWDDVGVMFRDYNQLQEIYFLSDVSNINHDGIAFRIQQLQGVFGSFLWYVYNLFKPLPPPVMHNFNFENTLLLVGNLFQYVLVLFILVSPFVTTRLKLRDVLMLLISVGIVSFVGGTQRHFIHFFIPVVFAFVSTSRSVRQRLYLVCALSAPILIMLYFVIR